MTATAAPGKYEHVVAAIMGLFILRDSNDKSDESGAQRAEVLTCDSSD